MATHLSYSPIYKKALEILSLSQDIAVCLNYDLSELDHAGKENPNIYFSGDIVQQSKSLAPEILKAESESLSDKKYKHAATVKYLAIMLNNTCKRLERCNSNGRDFLPLLRKELKKFNRLQHRWMLTL